jgi:hypothetical protein
METDWICEQDPSQDNSWTVYRIIDARARVQLADWLDEESARTLVQRLNG